MSSAVITSLQNPLMKHIVTLRDSKARREEGLTLVDGAREVARAQAAGAVVKHIIYCPVLSQGAFDHKQSKSLVEVSPPVFEKITFGQRIDGVIAVVKYPTRLLSTISLTKVPLVVILEAVEKPGNLGAIIRTCDSAGVDALLIADPKTDIYNPNVIRSSVSTVFRLPVVAGTNVEILAFLQQHRMHTAAAFVGAKTVYTKVDFKIPLAIVLGSEDKGLSAFWQEHSDVKVSIPMRGLADSLNVSVTAAVMIFEALRQRS